MPNFDKIKFYFGSQTRFAYNEANFDDKRFRVKSKAV